MQMRPLSFITPSLETFSPHSILQDYRASLRTADISPRKDTTAISICITAKSISQRPLRGTETTGNFLPQLLFFLR